MSKSFIAFIFSLLKHNVLNANKKFDKETLLVKQIVNYEHNGWGCS